MDLILGRNSARPGSRRRRIHGHPGPQVARSTLEVQDDDAPGTSAIPAEPGCDTIAFDPARYTGHPYARRRRTPAGPQCSWRLDVELEHRIAVVLVLILQPRTLQSIENLKCILVIFCNAVILGWIFTIFL